ARNFNGAIRDDLINIHVGLRARARLPNAQRELVIQLPGNDFVGGADNELSLVGRELAQVLIHQRASLLKRAKSPNQLRRHNVAPNIKMQQRTLRLRPPVNIRRNFNLPHAVRFNAGLSLGLGDGFGKGRHDDLLCAFDLGAPPLRLLQGWVTSAAEMRNGLLYGGVSEKRSRLVRDFKQGCPTLALFARVGFREPPDSSQTSS